MTPKEKLHELLDSLEEILVKEFLACQKLETLTKEEQAALSAQDATTLPSLTERKEVLLDEMGRLDEERRMLVNEISVVLDLRDENPTIASILNSLDQEPSERLSRLREGILILLDNVRNLTRVNQALASAAMERADALQTFLLDMFQPQIGYRPPGSTKPDNSVGAWEVDQTV